MKILVSALEASANLHLEAVLKHLKDAEICGIFDSKFGTPLYDSKEFSAMGFVEILPLILKAKRAIKEMTELARNCDVVLLIDSPAFNIPLAKAIKKANFGVRIIYYILPQVWAWKEKRAKIVEENCDELASIWKFERKFYPKSVYVGAPLLDEINQKYEPQNGVISFLPGSRRGEVARLMPIFREVAAEIKTQNPQAKFLLAVPNNLSDKINEIYGDISGFEVVNSAPKALCVSKFAFICSGTATLEAALIGVPFVLCFKAGWLDMKIARFFVKLHHAGLANIIFDFLGEDAMHDEILQENLTKERLLSAMKSAKPEKFLIKRDKIRAYLEHGSAENVANLIKKEK